MAIGRKMKSRSGVLEVQDLIVHGKIYLEGGKVVLQAKKGLVSHPTSFQVQDSDEITVAEVTTSGQIKARGGVTKQ